MTQSTDLLKVQRDIEVDLCTNDIRTIISVNGVTRSALSKVKARLLELAAHQELFNTNIFPVKDGDGTSSLYLLSEDENHEYALYVVSEKHGNMSPPHDHTTWAVIAGVEGEELNKFYDRLDDGKEKGLAKISESHTEVVSVGTGVALMPDDIHSIHTSGKGQTIHLHMYGS